MPEHAVRLMTTAARATAIVAQATTWEELPEVWGPMLDEVYSVVAPAERAGASASAEPRWQNVMLYKDDVPNVEVGVLMTGPVGPSGPVVNSLLPAGEVAMVVHRGPYAGLDVAHSVVRDWCAARGHELSGPRWEIYGHWREDPQELETEVYYLLR